MHKGISLKMVQERLGMKTKEKQGRGSRTLESNSQGRDPSTLNQTVREGAQAPVRRNHFDGEEYQDGEEDFCIYGMVRFCVGLWKPPDQAPHASPVAIWVKHTA